MPKKISAVIACYTDERAIPIMYSRLKKVFAQLHLDYEIIFVNDGSPDNSEAVIGQIVKQDANVIGINHARNFGSQLAFTSGMNIATGDALVFLDGDLQDPPELISDFYAKWQSGYDVVYGVRIKREAPILMQIMYKLFYKLFHHLSYIKVPLDAGDFSLIDRKVVNVLKLFTERDRFMRGLRAWVGFKQTGVPYVRPERMFGKSTNNLFKNFNWAMKGIFSFSYVPLQFMTITSLIVFIIALAAMSLQVFLRLAFPESAPKGTTTILISVLFIGAIQLFGISILGEYIGKIFEEVKGRPLYIVKSIQKNNTSSNGRTQTKKTPAK